MKHGNDGLRGEAAPEGQAVAFKGWYCAHCQRGVDASEVTNHEQHEVCGRVITDDRPQPVAVAGDAVPSLRWLEDNHTAWIEDDSDTPYLVWLRNALLALPAPAAPAPVAGDAVAKLLQAWDTPPTKAGPGWIEKNARRECANQLRAALAQDRASQAGAAGVPEGLLSRLEEAARRVENGHAPRRIPADPSDLDLALSEVIAWLKGEAAPFWVPTPAAEGEARNG